MTAALIIPPDDIQGRLPHTQRLGHRQFANNTAAPLGRLSDCVSHRSRSQQGGPGVEIPDLLCDGAAS